MDIAVHETSTPTVLVAGVPREWVATRLGDADLVTAESAADAVGALDDRAVDCVVAGPDLAGGDGVDLLTAIDECAPDLSVIYAPPTGDAADAAAATSAGATEYLPRDLAEDGALRERVAAAVDRSDRRRQAEREREMFRVLMGDAPLSIYFKDEDARHVAASSHVTASIDDRLIGKTDLEAYGDEIGEGKARESYEDDLRVIETGEPIVDKEQRHVTGEGEVMWLRTTKLPWRDDDGEVVGLLGITRVVTEIKERELEIEREKRRLEQFASFVSHDLRTPVTAARGYARRALASGDDEYVEEVLAAVDRMDQLIDDLLGIARPAESGVLCEWTPLADLARKTWTLVDSGEATLRVEVPDDVELEASRGGLRQVLENLFTNAIDHADDPDVTVEVGLTDTGFYVADDGPGVPPEEREAVFEYGHTTGGTGIGLALVAEVADVHGWVPRVTESATGGARFEFDRCIRRPRDATPDGAPVDLSERANVGGARPVGQARRTGPGEWTVRGGGRNLWGTVDEYYAVYAPVEGDVRIEGRVAAFDPIHEYSKAGLLLADAAETGRPLAFVGATAAHGPETAWRVDPDGDVTTRQHETGDGDRRFRIDRIGDRVTCYVQDDGWTVLDQHVPAVSEAAVAGIAVCSHNEGRHCEATFEDVRVVDLAPDEG